MLILLTGASGSGKSTYATQLALRQSGDLTFISTEIPDDAIKADQTEIRRMGFTFVECYTNVGGLEISGGTAVLDCLCNLTANEMFDENGDIRENVVLTVVGDVLKIAERFDTLIVVTNEISSDGTDYDTGTNGYRNSLCEINREIAKCADVVYEMCVSIPIALKGKSLIAM